MNAKLVLAENVKALKAHYKLANLAFAKMCGVSNGSIGRITKAQVAADLDTIQAIAAACGLQVWQLLAPDLDPKNPHVITDLTPSERALYKKLAQAFSSEINSQ